jgi:DNA ligase-1
MLELDEFTRGSSEISLTARVLMLDALLGGCQFAEPLPQIRIESREHFETLVADATQMGYEGLMIRKDVGYEGKRSKNLLKVKKMHDAEYVVTGAEMGTHRVIEEGREVEEEMLKAIFVQHKGNQVRVGSGFNLEQRRKYFKNPDEIVGKTITVQFFEETTDQHGQHSLRFPVIKTIYETKREF